MKVTHNAGENKFQAWSDDGECLGEIVYAPSGDQILATSTYVDNRFRGQGVAQILLDALAAYAEERHATIVPVCSYVVTAFERNPERYRKVIPEE